MIALNQNYYLVLGTNQSSNTLVFYRKGQKGSYYVHDLDLGFQIKDMILENDKLILTGTHQK